MIAIVRVAVRTFQNLEHVELFLSIGASTEDGLLKAGLEEKFTISQSIFQPNQVVSFWEYKDEDHISEFRKLLSAQSRLPTSLTPKEIAYETKVRHLS